MYSVPRRARLHLCWQGWPSTSLGLTGELPKEPHRQERGRGACTFTDLDSTALEHTSLPSFDLLWQSTKGRSLDPRDGRAGRAGLTLRGSGRCSRGKCFGSLSFLCHQSGSVGKSKMPKVLAGEFFVPFKCIWLTLMTYESVYLLLGRNISLVRKSFPGINYKSQRGMPGEIPSRNLLVRLCLLPNIKHEQSWWKLILIQLIQIKTRPWCWTCSHRAGSRRTKK